MDRLKRTQPEAFKKLLVASQFNSNRLSEFQNDPRFVIREVEHLDFRPKYNTLSEAAVTAKQLFDELREHYGINAPIVGHVVAYDKKGNQKLYTITHRIHPTDDAPPRRQERRVAYKRLFGRLLDYLEDKYKRGGEFLYDIPPRPGSIHDQYVYGQKEGDKSPTLYLVDTDPKFFSGLKNLLVVVENLLAEMKAAREVDLDDEQRRCGALLDRIKHHISLP